MAICPLTSAPGANGVVSDTPNHALNWATSVRARQTRARGASRTICFSIRSVDVVDMVVSVGLVGAVVGMPEQLDETLDADVPERFVAAQPVVGPRQRPGVDPDVMNASAHGTRHQAGALER